RGASLSDIHLCHKRTPTRHIVRNLRSAFPNDRETKELDLIFIVGDVFDTEVPAHLDDWFETKLWVNGLLRMAKANDITVVVLEGTPSHDWKQSRLFVAENDDSNIGADLHYV